MKLRDVASDSFYLLQVDSDPEEALRLLDEGPDVSHVIVHRVEDDEEYYYLFERGEAAHRLLHASAGEGLRVLLDLHEWSATATRPAGEPLTMATPPQAVVLENGAVHGFIDRRERAARGAGAARRSVTAEPTAGEDGVLIEGALEATFPEKVEQGTAVSLLVALVAESTQEEMIPVALPAGEEIEVIVQPRKGFKVVGPAEATLIVTDPATAMPVRFKLEGVDIGPGEIRILAFHGGACLGQMRLFPEVLPAGAVSGAPIVQRQDIAATPGAAADLTLLIEESLVEGKLAYYLRLFAQDPALGLPLSRFGPLTIEIEPMAYFTEFFKDIDQLPIKSAADKAETARVLERKGAALYDMVFPEGLKTLLWQVRDRIHSLIIQSEEPWIPWEICRMSGTNDQGLIEEGPFLCERYVIARWNPQETFKQPLSLKEMALVVPQDSGLDFAQAEGNLILGLASPERKVTSIRAEPADVQAAMASGRYSAFHFTGHGAMNGANPDRSEMKLERGKVFRPEDLSGRVRNLRAGRPIVFLNACQIGAGAMGLTGLGGWAQRFVESGAGAFLGAYWSVIDRTALAFAEVFYRELIKGKPIGEAVLVARLSIRDAGDPTWLAYTLFAHPLSAVVP